jgi:hypothetical protein
MAMRFLGDGGENVEVLLKQYSGHSKKSIYHNDPPTSPKGQSANL